MGLLQNIKGLIRFRYKLYYSYWKAYFNKGSFVYSINDNVKFVCNSNDYFSKILFISNGHEKMEMEWCRLWLTGLNQSSLVIDCGANIGYFSSYLAQTNLDKKIISIEGNKNTFLILQNNIQKLELKNVEILNGILAESTDKIYLVPNTPGREPWQQAQEALSSDVITLTLDSISQRYSKIPELVKIDCEGFEVKILKGANRILEQGETVFMVECNDTALNNADTNRQDLFNLFEQNNYKLFHLASFGLPQPVGLEIKYDFPSTEFNFAAIPNKPDFVDRWNLVLNQLKNKVR